MQVSPPINSPCDRFRTNQPTSLFVRDGSIKKYNCATICFVSFFPFFSFFGIFGINLFRMNGVLEECWVFSVGWIFYPSPNWLFFYFGITGMRTTFSVFGVTWQKTWKNDFSLRGRGDVKRPQIFRRISRFFFFIKSDTGLKYFWNDVITFSCDILNF